MFSRAEGDENGKNASHCQRKEKNRFIVKKKKNKKPPESWLGGWKSENGETERLSYWYTDIPIWESTFLTCS